LEPAKAAEIERVLDRHAPERQKLHEKLRDHRRELNRLLEGDSNDQQAYERAIRGLREAQEQLFVHRRKELDELGRALTPKQQAKLVRALRQMQRKLNKHLRDHNRQK
jgi:Spy/CpxP family protein refolding chaperone